MSYYTDKILNNYNKSKTNFNYNNNEEDSDEEESEVMTEQYESESNENLDNKYSYGGGNYSNPYGGINNSKPAATGGISKYLNPGKLMSSTSAATGTYSANKFEKKSNPYARSSTADPYSNDTYNIDIDLNKIKKDSETFQTNKNKNEKIDKTGKAATNKNKKRSISYGWTNDKDLKENNIDERYDLPDEIVIDNNIAHKGNKSNKGIKDSHYQLKNEGEINKFLNEDIDSESEDDRYKKDLKKLPPKDNAKKKSTKSHLRSVNKNDSVSISESIKSKSNSKSKLDSYYEECASKLNDKSKSEISGEIKDSTISIDYYMDKSESKNKSQSKIKEPESSTHSIQNAKVDISRSEITKSNREKEIDYNYYNEQSQEEDYSYNKLNNSKLDKEEYLRKTAAFATGAKINLKEEPEKQKKEEFNSCDKQHDTITSDADDKYNDFMSASKLDNHSAISENEVDIYNQFDEISSNLPLDMSQNNTPSITYNNFGSSLVKTISPKAEINLQGKSQASQKDKENTQKSNIYEMKSHKFIGNKEGRQEQQSNQENIQNAGIADNILTKSSQDTGIIFTNSNNNPNNQANMHNRSFDLKFNNEYIQNIIIEEFRKLISPVSNSAHIHNNPYSDLLNKLNLISSGSLGGLGGVASLTSSTPLPMQRSKTCDLNHNSTGNNPTNIPYAREEVTNRIVSYLVDKSANFLIYSDSTNKLKTFDTNVLKVSKNEEIVLYRSTQPKRDIREMKLQLSIEEERKEKEFHKMNYYKSKETIEDLEIKLKKFRKLEIENSEIKKINLDTEAKYEELEKDYRELKIDYDNKIKFVEERVILRESKSENKKVIEISRNFEIEIENLKNEIKEKNTDIEEYKNKYEYFEGLNTKLSLNKFSNIETNDKIKELRGENFILHEKCNELLDKLEKSHREKEKLEKKLFHKEIFPDEEKKLSEKLSSNIDKKITDWGSKSNSGQNQFDQILIEREFNVQETIIKSYIKEIERLNKEISFLKNITLNTGANAEKTKYIFPQDNQNFSKTKNQKIKNNFIDHRDKNLPEMDIAELNSQETDSYPENNFVKESAQAKIKLLKKFLSSGEKNMDISNLENEFLILEKSKSQNKNKRVEISDSEFDLETFLAILKKFNNNNLIPLSKYELIEIFNNFPRTSKNKIRLSDFIHALKSSRPYNYFIQPDPHYLTELESKVIKYENILGKIEKEKEELKKIENELKNKNLELESDKKEFGKKINELENFNENCMGMFMKNINMNMSNSKFPDNTHNIIDNSQEIKKLNDKIKNLEKENSTMKLNSYKEFETKIFQYEEKFKILAEKNFSCQNSSQENQKINLQLNTQIKDLELKNINKNEKIEEKLLKYKQNYRILKEKLILSEKEKEKFFKVLNQNLNGDEKLNSQKIQNFFMNSDQIDSIVQKIESLESRNKEREEYYRQLCYKANNYQVNKEIESVTKKFELEKKEYFKIINQKNSELTEIKKEFEEMLRQLEEIKSNKRFNRV